LIHLREINLLGKDERAEMGNGPLAQLKLAFESLHFSKLAQKGSHIFGCFGS